MKIHSGLCSDDSRLSSHVGEVTSGVGAGHQLALLPGRDSSGAAVLFLKSRRIFLHHLTRLGC